MKILILGPNGQLGTALLALNRKKISPFDMEPVGRSDLDLGDLSSIKAKLLSYNFQILVNCTAYNRVDDAELDSSESLAVNAEAVKAMALACQEKRALFIHVSTDYVFDGTSRRPYLETDPAFPINQYGVSKLKGEGYAKKFNKNTLILRTASLYGRSQSTSKGGNFVETMLKVCQKTGLARVVNDVCMSPTSSRDLARMILGLVESGAELGTYHAVNSGQATWYDFTKEIVMQAKISAEIIAVGSDEYRTKAKRPAFTVLDNSRLAALVGPIRHWKEALGEYLKGRGLVE